MPPIAAYARQQKYKQAWEYVANSSTEPGHVKDLFYTPTGVALEERRGAKVDPARRVRSGLVAGER